MSKNGNKLYHIQFDHVSYFVEAANLALAIVAWKRHVAKEWGKDYCEDDEPESIALVHDEPVIR